MDILMRALRFAEHHLPISILISLLFPLSAARAAYELTVQSTFMQLHRLSKTARLSGANWRHCPLKHAWNARLAMCMLRFIRLWPDKLREPRWSRRCQFIGLAPLEAILGQGRPVVLLTLHYGNPSELYHWLRSRGIGVAFLAGRDSLRPPKYRNEADRANGLEGVACLFGTDYLSLGQARYFLARPNRVLAVLIEGDPKIKSTVLTLGAGCSMYMAKGALHLAQLSGAAVIPCLIRADKYLRATILFGQPLESGIIAHRDRHPLARGQILRQLEAWIAEQPAQCWNQLIHSFRFPKKISND